MRSLLALCALLTLAQLAAAQPRHDGVDAYELGSFYENDGDCGALYVTDRTVSAYAEPRAVGAPIRRVEAGRRIVPSVVSNVLVVLREPGRLVARRDLTISDAQRYDADEERALRIRRGARIEVLSYGGEGYVGFRVDGVKYSACEHSMPIDAEWVTADTRRDFTVESFPQIEVWVRLVPREGRPAAWLNTRQPGVRLDGGPAGCEPLAGE